MHRFPRRLRYLTRAVFGGLFVLNLVETGQGAPNAVKWLKAAGVAYAHPLGILIAVILAVVFGLAAVGPARLRALLSPGQVSEPAARPLPASRPTAPIFAEKRRAYELIMNSIDYPYREMIHDEDSDVPGLIAHLGPGLVREPGPLPPGVREDATAHQAARSAVAAHGSREVQRLVAEFDHVYENRFSAETRARGRGGRTAHTQTRMRAVIDESKDVRRRLHAQIQHEIEEGERFGLTGGD